MNTNQVDVKTRQPYLVIPKLIEQPTWGGTYITEFKNWEKRPEFVGKKIGQSYELYDKSNLSFCNDSSDPTFTGELADPNLVKEQTKVEDSLLITHLISQDPDGVLGKKYVEKFGTSIPLLLKFTQALGNSFQLHVTDGMQHPKWKPKPESWYYFEPGLITCGVKVDIDWEEYKKNMMALDVEIQTISKQVKVKSLGFIQAKNSIDIVIKKYDPWQYVNLVHIHPDTLLDLSACGIHHSWEEDLKTIPLGNVLYEIQLNVMDDAATIRNFDKGKMKPDGTLRQLHIEDYFSLIDKSSVANNPETHLRKAQTITKNSEYKHDLLLTTKYYSLERIVFAQKFSTFLSKIETYRHVFVKNGTVDIITEQSKIHVTRGHSVFIPADCREYSVVTKISNTEILISY